MLLSEGKLKENYKVEKVTGDEEMKSFLFSLGCFEGEIVTIMKILGSNYVINIKGSRYGIDKNLANIIEVR